MKISKENLVSRVFIIAIALSMVLPAGVVLTTASTSAVNGDPTIDIAPIASSTMIRLQKATFDTNIGAPMLPSAMSVPDIYPDTWLQPYIVQSDGPITDEWKTQIADTGAEIVSYIPDIALLVRIPRPEIAALSKVLATTWPGVYQPFYKFSPNLEFERATV